MADELPKRPRSWREIAAELARDSNPVERQRLMLELMAALDEELPDYGTPKTLFKPARPN